MDILAGFPVAEKHFLDHMSFTYGVTRFTFNEAPFEEKCRAIARFLGHPTVFPRNWDNNTLEHKIREYLYIYEEACKKHPNGVDDPMEKMNAMSYQERVKAYPEMHKPREVIYSLKNALKPIPKGQVVHEFMLSIKDALRDIENPIMPEISDDTFWQECIESSWKFKAGELTCPF